MAPWKTRLCPEPLEPHNVIVFCHSLLLITLASYGIICNNIHVFLKMFKLQHVSLILRECLKSSSKESRTTETRHHHLKAERKAIRMATWMEDQNLSERASCLNKLNLFILFI